MSLPSVQHAPRKQRIPLRLLLAAGGLLLLATLARAFQAPEPGPPTSAGNVYLPANPVLLPEAERAFLQDGPGLLLTAEQRTALLVQDGAARERFIREFLAQPGLAGLAEAIELRRRVAAKEFLSPTDVRWQLLFLNGPPAQRVAVDCGIAFQPLEVWTWNGTPPGGTQRQRSLVIYRPSGDEPFRAWQATDAKSVLYTPEMQYYLEQWEELRGQLMARRFDLQACKETPLIDRVTGVPGLTGARGGEVAPGGRRAYGQRPQLADDEGFLDPPRDLAGWIREAAATPAPPAVARLAVPTFEIQFPERAGQRMQVRGILQVMAGRMKEGAGEQAGDHEPAAQLTMQGVIERGGKVFESFGLRFRLRAAAEGQPVALEVDRELRPHASYVMRLKIHDDATGAEATVAHGFEVPEQPVPAATPIHATGPVAQEGPGQDLAATRLASHSLDTLTLLPPEDDVVMGLWRAEALVTGKRIVKVVFLVDGKQQFVRSSRPFSVELRLNRYPTEQVVRAEGYDAEDKLVAADDLILNEPRGGLTVTILEPPRGAKVTGSQVKVKASITLPQERRVKTVELRVNDKLVKALSQPPWEATLEVPAKDETAYLTVAAELDDGSRAEAVRFLRSPENTEEIEVNLVEVYATVTDGSGQLVRGLTAADFELLEGGQPQKIAKFEQVENLPLTLGILIDTSGSMAVSLGEAVRAAGGFLERLVRPGDHCFALTFSDHPVLRMPLTDDAKATALALEKLQAVGGTSIHDALVHSLYYFRGTHGQRALVLLSDGDDNSSLLSFDEALEYAKRSGVAIYTIGLKIPKVSVDIRHKLNRLSELTGGRVFYVNGADELAGTYAEIEKELRSRYLLAYQSGRQASEAGYRPIEVKVKKAGLKARTARGYYP